MTVIQLIKRLQKEDPKALVVLSRDPEGNGFEELVYVDGDYMFADGEIGYSKITPALKKQGFTEDDILDGKRAVVLWP